MIKEKRRKQRLFKKLLIALLVFMILTVIAVFVVINVFVVKNVKVEGNKLYDEQLITETVLNDEYSWNSLYVLLKYTFVDTKDVPFIDAMEVKLVDPQTLKIKVYEKGMLGYLYIPTIGENAYFDKDGFVVEISTRIIENVPRIEGISCDEVVLYEKLPINNQKLREILTLTLALQRAEFKSELAQVLMRENLTPDIIHFGLEQSPVVSYENTEVWLGSIELLTEKVKHLLGIYPSINGMPGVLHMENWDEQSGIPKFEKLPEVVEEETETESENDEGNMDSTEAEGEIEEEQDDGEDVPVDAETPQDDEESPENDDEDVSN